MKRIQILLTILLISSSALAQNTITFTAETTTGTENVTPVLTWDTAPLADNCIASGDWSGDKGGAGSETLLPITSGATYNITCEWSGNSATLSWTAPTQNTDGSPLTDLAGYVLYWGSQSGEYTNSLQIDDPAATSFVVAPLAQGTWFFVATALNALGIESDFSSEATKIVGLDSQSESVGITVNPRPNAPSAFNVQ